MTDQSHAVIIDRQVKCPIGALSLVQNQPQNLSVSIDRVWLTPAFQGTARKIMHESMLLILEWLFRIGYRRVSVEVDSRHVIMRKFLERCGFRLEAVLRKHKIFQKRNRDTALYVILNNEFHDVDLKLKRHIGLPLKPPTQKVAEIKNVMSIKPSSTSAPDEVVPIVEIANTPQQRKTLQDVSTPRELISGIISLHPSCLETKLELNFDPHGFPAAKEIIYGGVKKILRLVGELLFL
jgi:hypothetical protein